MADESINRQRQIQSILDGEIEDGEDLAAEARKIVEYLLLEKKGYEPEDVQKNVIFELKLGRETVNSSVDFIVSANGKQAMIIKCSSGSLSSRERQAVAAARVISSTPVPFAVVADPATAEVLEVKTGAVIGEGFGAIPVKTELLRLLAETGPISLTPERIDREKRILLAFDAIKCCVPRGADGGVRIAETEESQCGESGKKSENKP